VTDKAPPPAQENAEGLAKGSASQESSQDSSEDSTQDTPLPLISHLAELRDRLLRAIVSVLVVFIVLFPFSNDLYSFVSQPLRDLLPENTTMIATEVTSPFFAPFKLAMFTALFVAMPYVLFQIWSFVAPGMYRQEKRLALPILGSSVVLFYFGAAFAYFVVFKLVFGFFIAVAPDGIAITPDINSYLNFVLKLFFAFGLAFEIPIAAVIAIASGVTTADDLARKRPYIIVGCFVFGMLLTPPDIISQSLLALPMWLLFEAGVIAGRFLIKNQNKSSTSS
jgi:sec-independent protein translocase protein TatC